MGEDNRDKARQWLCAWLLSRDLSDADAARILGTNPATISCWRNGRSPVPRAVMLALVGIDLGALPIVADIFEPKPK